MITSSFIYLWFCFLTPADWRSIRLNDQGLLPTRGLSVFVFVFLFVCLFCFFFGGGGGGLWGSVCVGDVLGMWWRDRPSNTHPSIRVRLCVLGTTSECRFQFVNTTNILFPFHFLIFSDGGRKPGIILRGIDHWFVFMVCEAWDYDPS